MKYDERLQALVLRVLHETGLMSEQELLDHIQTTLSDITDTSGLEVAQIHLALQRWKARGAVSVQVIDSITRYKIAKIPPWFASCNMANLVKMRGKEAKEYIKRLDEEYGGGDTVVPTSAKYKDFVKVEITFETVTEILGTIPDGDKTQKLYRDGDGKVFIPISWQKGYIRSNAPLIDGTGSLQQHIGVGIGRFEEEVKLCKVDAYPHPKSKGGKSPGLIVYEAIAPGQRFKTIWRVSMKGTKLRNIDNLKEWLEETGISPIRGMGGNPFLKGGLITPVELQELPAMSFM
ncbi:MAG: hypothetical protein NWE89_11735 [Candidatus Bathyarchaeota archaeon]|nr:hypothetical protein [Candidatus Bathyarchaeota archaeon]